MAKGGILSLPFAQRLWEGELLMKAKIENCSLIKGKKD